MKKLKIAYFGTPDFSAYFLEKILKDKDLPIEVKLVVTQPPKKVGRKQIITESPVANVAVGHQVFLVPWVPPKGSSQVTKKLMSLLQKIDIALLYAYGVIIPKDLLKAPKYGFWNIHPSLLPKYRGTSPVAYPLIAGERETGVTLMKMDERMDHGPIIAQKKLKINPRDRRMELTYRLTDLAYDVFKRSILNFDKVSLKSQNHSRATYTKLLKKEGGYIPFENWKLKIENSPKELFNLFRGLHPWPGVWTIIEIKGVQKRLKITDMDLVKGKLIIKKVQLEGKTETDFKTFNKVYKVF
jgi:methionyl-tRNA formyltransferase